MILVGISLVWPAKTLDAPIVFITRPDDSQLYAWNQHERSPVTFSPYPAQIWLTFVVKKRSALICIVGIGLGRLRTSQIL